MQLQSDQNVDTGNPYGQVMPDMLESQQEPQLVPVHLQHNMFARDIIPLHNEKNSKGSESMMPPEVLVNGLFQKRLPVPSHTVLNHINCWQPNPERYTWNDQTAQEQFLA